uniref:Cuticle proprotein proCP3.3 n=1 Tax=Callinectes sapidus TaxID=6763 RepID=A6YPV2_CALSI|nr:cuticle proprotein proCP3.3 [Callinectes sapidus]
MKILVVLCLMAVGTNAKFGKHGIVMPDGVNVQFTHDQAENILMIGPSGAITADGKHVQLDRDGLPVARAKRAVLLEGPSGVLFEDGQWRHLPPGVEIVLMSKTGAILSNGDNVQFRKKRSSPLIDSIKGPSGYITPTGQLFQLPPGVTVAIEGPSSALLSDGTAIQFFA